MVDKIKRIDTEQRRVEAVAGQYDYDWLIIATGCDIQPAEIDGMLDGWRESIFDVYILEGALALRRQLKYFDSGRVVLSIAEVPYKCPIAPLEFVFLADWFFTVNGVRDKVEIELVTLLDNVFTKPVAAKALAQVDQQKIIKVTRISTSPRSTSGTRSSSLILDLLDRMADLPGNVDLDQAKPAGMWELLGTLRGPDFRQGMGIMLELTRGMAHLKA